MWIEERCTELYTGISIQSANSVGKYCVYAISSLPVHEHLLADYNEKKERGNIVKKKEPGMRVHIKLTVSVHMTTVSIVEYQE